jgi:FtsH-binding integral membrane protein
MSAYAFPIAAQASETERAAFIRRTYAHLAGAVAAFAGLEAVLVNIPGIEGVVGLMLHAWWVVILLAVVAGWLADYWAQSAASPGMQYMGLGLYVVVEAIVFLPLLYIAQHFVGEHVIASAGIFTVAIFAGLTVAVFITRSDFSYLGPILSCAGFLVMGLIVCSFFFPLMLGTWFSFAMVGLSCAYILYYTSNVLHHYRTDQHVAAALALFAAVALLFWYILRIFMSRDN